MKKGIVFSIIAFSFVCTASVYGAQGFYVSGNVGLAMLSDADAEDPSLPGIAATMEFDSGVILSAALGYEWENFRLEGEYAYQTNDFDKQEAFGLTLDLTGDLVSQSLLVNGYYDFATQSKFTPFITAGLGMARVDVNDLALPGSWQEPYSDDDTVFAGQVGAGISYAVHEQFDIDLQYRYFMTDDLEFSDGSTLDGLASHNIYLGLRYRF